MESKGCFVCCVLMILVISAQAESDVKAQIHHEAALPSSTASDNVEPRVVLRSSRGVLGSAMKGAAVGALAGGAYHMLKG